MKKSIRFGVFETNSSSTHSLTMCSKEDYQKWENGELIYDRYAEKLIPITDEIKKEIEEDDYQYETCEGFENGDLETFYDTYVTDKGEEIVAFGKYGYDG